MAYTIDFPAPSASPFDAPNGVTYTWDGVKWVGSGDGSTLDFVKIPGDTMTGNLNLPSLNTYGFPTESDKASAEDGDKLVYRTGPDALVLENTQVGTEVKVTGGSTPDAALVSPRDPQNAGQVACTMTSPSTGFHQMLITCHGVFTPGTSVATFLVGIFTEISGGGFFNSDYVTLSAKDVGQGDIPFSVQGYYNLDPTKRYVSRIGIQKESGSGTPSPIRNCSMRAVYFR